MTDRPADLASGPVSRPLPTPGPSRIAPGDREHLGLVGWAITRVSGAVGGTTPPHLFRTIGRHRKLFRGWLRFASTLMPNGRLPRRETELVILRVAHLKGCAYEFDHHVHLGAQAGVTDRDVARVLEGPGAEGWSEREQAILEGVDQLHRDGDVDDVTWVALRKHLDETSMIELVLLVGHYEMLATAINTLRIQPDGPQDTLASRLGGRLAARVARRGNASGG